MKILQLTNYPTSKPQHGGQIRARQLAEALRRAGHEVKAVAVYPKDAYKSDSQDDVIFAPDSPFWRSEIDFLSDYLSGIYAAEDREAFGSLARTAAEHRPDVIISEHPWLMQVARKLADAQGGSKLVYSSHNVEFRLKRGILDKAKISPQDRARLVHEIEQLEHDAVRHADLVIACTTADADYYRDHVAGCPEVVVAGNGVEPFACKPARVEAWRHFFGAPFPVFVSSAHIPNASGFWEMMTPGLTFLRPDERVIVVGGVSNLIDQIKGFEAYAAVNRSRMEVMGLMEKSELQALVTAAHAIMLPIVEGEGSNLKTAEALEAGCSIVGTTKAFRGFEEAKRLPHVHIADEPEAFRRKVREVLDAPRYDRGTPEAVRARFYWAQLLSEAVSRIGALDS